LEEAGPSFDEVKDFVKRKKGEELLFFFSISPGKQLFFSEPLAGFFSFFHFSFTGKGKQRQTENNGSREKRRKN
jgi:hypothetical protein